ncbi:tetratricopeptide repeat protein [Caulifigura coniformis]|uniref:Tetratricopeptide repeat protein n=1 Tax=Caulifigura coniformis TaxID=2527983 RepID=A0A517SLY6_9PLAN|nr:tetratricopeptide repeat protein [Caulifigura coniformis]QDT57139.1 tetratricopeptide repeat protein [Caulifigura coniformis]
MPAFGSLILGQMAEPTGIGWLLHQAARWTSGPWAFVYVIVLIWMLAYCAKYDPDRGMWLWIMLLFHPFGTIAYFFIRWLPSSTLQPPKFLQRFLGGRELERKRIAAAQIGNAHQHVELGDALREIGRLKEAGDAYDRALEKDPKNLAALWGAGLVAYRLENYSTAREKLASVLEIDPSYKFGDVSLTYANTLLKLNENEAAQTHLEQHTKRWRHPESLYRLAEIHAQNGEPKAARELLQGLIMDVDASPKAISRKFYFWKGRAKRLIRKLPAA